MHVTELDSFVQKFNQLWKAGLTAHLDLDCHAGNAWVGLRVQLGPVPPGPNHHPYHHVPPPRYRGPSYSRRLEKRRAARCQASPSQSPTAEVSDDQLDSEKSEAVKATMENINEHVEVIEKVTQKDSRRESSEAVEDVDKNKQEEKNTEKVITPEYHDCPICDFRSTWTNGLKIHMNRMHTKLEQIDGCVDRNSEEYDAKYENSAHYWERGQIGVAYHSFLDANSVIDTSDAISEEEKVEEKAKLLEARKNVFGNKFSNYPPWKLK